MMTQVFGEDLTCENITKYHIDTTNLVKTLVTHPSDQLFDMVMERFSRVVAMELTYLSNQQTEADFWAAVDFVCGLYDSKRYYNGTQPTYPDYFHMSIISDLLNEKTTQWGDAFILEWHRRFDNETYERKLRMSK